MQNPGYAPRPLPSSPLVSVITALHNREGRVTASIRSVLEQTYTHLEVIAVDDGSSDGTLRELQSIRDPRLTVLTHANSGLVASFRRAIDSARGELIAVHGASDISFPTRIERQVAAFLSQPHLGVVGCHIENELASTGKRRVARKAINGTQLEWLLTRNVFSHGEVMYRKDLYEFVGGYRPAFRYAQDLDLWLRMCDHTRFHIVDEVLYRRVTYWDSVRSSVEKRAVQNLLGELAVQSYFARRRGDPDPVVEHGPYAIALLGRSAMVAQRHAALARDALKRRDIAGARKIIRLSLEQRFSLSAMFLGWRIWLAGFR